VKEWQEELHKKDKNLLNNQFLHSLKSLSRFVCQEIIADELLTATQLMKLTSECWSVLSEKV
jgi:hypothetical protein